MELELGWLGGVELFISRQRLIRWDGVELVFDIHAAAGNCTANPIQSNPIQSDSSMLLSVQGLQYSSWSCREER